MKKIFLLVFAMAAASTVCANPTKLTDRQKREVKTVYTIPKTDKECTEEYLENNRRGVYSLICAVKYYAILPDEKRVEISEKDCCEIVSKWIRESLTK